MSDDCTTNFWGGYAYCVGVGTTASTTSQTSTSSSTAGSGSRISSSTSSSRSTVITITSSSLTTSSAVTTANATYSIREPIYTWNVTTTTVESTFPPQKTQAGQPTYCNNWYFVRPGDTCASIAASITWMSLTDLLEWNPALDSDCSGLYVDWWVCIGVQPQSVTTSFEYITSAPVVVVPTKTGDYTPTTFPAVDSSFTASPTQAGLATSCQAFHQAQDGDLPSGTSIQYSNSGGIIRMESYLEWELRRPVGGLLVLRGRISVRLHPYAANSYDEPLSHPNWADQHPQSMGIDLNDFYSWNTAVDANRGGL